VLSGGAQRDASPLSPDVATQRDQVRRFLNVLTAAAAAAGGLLAVQGVGAASGKTLAMATVVLAFAALLVMWPRRVLAEGRIEAAVAIVALSTSVLIFTTALISPAGAFISAAGLLIPITAAVPYLETRRLRWLMVFAWVGTVATAATSLLADATVAATPGGASSGARR
jgi:hypothetical protein